MWIRIAAVPQVVAFAYAAAIAIGLLIDHAALDFAMVTAVAMSTLALFALLRSAGRMAGASESVGPIELIAQLAVGSSLALLIYQGNEAILMGAATRRLFAILLSAATMVTAATTAAVTFKTRTTAPAFSGFIWACIALALLALFSWIGFLSSSQESIFVGYLLIGWLFSLTGLVAQSAETDVANPETLFNLHVAETARSGVLGMLRVGVPLVFTILPLHLALIITWPFTLAHALWLGVVRSINNVPRETRTSMPIGALSFPIAALLLTLCVYALSYAEFRDGGYSRVMFFIILASMWLRHISYLFVSLPAQLRVSTSRPYLMFIGISIVEFVALVLALAPLLQNVEPRFLTYPHVLATAQHLFRYADWSSWLTRGIPAYSDLATAALGLAFNIGIAGAMVRLALFRKTRVETERDALALVRSGDLSGALQLVEQFPTNSSAVLEIEAAVDLACGNLQEAAEKCREFIHHHRQKPTDARTIYMLINLAQTISADCATVRDLLVLGCTWRVPDAVIALLAGCANSCNCDGDTTLGLGDDNPNKGPQLVMLATSYPVTIRAFVRVYGDPVIGGLPLPLEGDTRFEPLSDIAARSLDILSAEPGEEIIKAELDRKIDAWLSTNAAAIDAGLTQLTDPFELALAAQYLVAVQVAARHGHHQALEFARERFDAIERRLKGDILAEMMVKMARVMR